MKKLTTLLFMLILSITLLSVTSCRKTNSTVPSNDAEARKHLQIWLDTHPIEPPAILAPENKEYIHENNKYYWFSLVDVQRYWLNFLVRKETGELFYMMLSDGEEPVIEIEPLDDWYKKLF